MIHEINKSWIEKTLIGGLKSLEFGKMQSPFTSLDMPYHHLIMAIPWQLRIVIMMNRRAGLNLITQAATEAVQQWARDIKKMRMGIRVVIHTFGADMKWHPHIHLIVTGGGLSLDGKRWIQTDPRFLMHHGGLKKRKFIPLSGVLFDTSPISTSP